MCRPGAVFAPVGRLRKSLFWFMSRSDRFRPRRTRPAQLPDAPLGTVMECVPMQPQSAALERDSGAALEPKPERPSIPPPQPRSQQPVCSTVGRTAWPIRSRSGKGLRRPSGFRASRRALQSGASHCSACPCTHALWQLLALRCPPTAQNAPARGYSAHGGVLLCRTCGAHRSSR